LGGSEYKKEYKIQNLEDEEEQYQEEINWYELREFAKSAHEQVPGEYCFYCGDNAESRDHLVPTSIRGAKDDIPWVYSCQQCNSILGARWEPNPWKLREVVQERLLKKNTYLLGGQWHTESDLMEFGRGLRQQMAGKIIKRWDMLQRVSFPSKPPVFGSQIAKDSLQAAFKILKIPPSEKYKVAVDEESL
jgi:hypothetical protein